MSPTRRLLLKKILVRLAFGIAALATLTVLFFAEERWRGRRTWEAYRLAAEARGEKIWLPDYYPADVPAADNYAANPFIEAVFQKGADAQTPPPMLPSLTGEKKKRPSLGNINTGTRPDLQEWRDFLGGEKASPGSSPAQDVLAWLATEAPALQHLREAGARRRCHFPTAWEKGYSTMLPHLPALTTCSVLFRLSVSANLAAGQPAPAASEVGHLFRLHTALCSEPSIIAGLVSNTVLENAIGAIQEGLASGQWTEADLREFEKQLEATNLLADFRRAMGTERGAFNTEAVRMASMSGRELREFWEAAQLGSLKVAYLPSGWIWQNMVKANEYYDSVLAPYRPTEAGEPEFIPARPSADSWIRAHLGTSGFQSAYYFLLNALLPATDTCEANFLTVQTRVLQARLGCALERYRKAKGLFPEKLESLVPEFLAAVPKDICDGQPMRYRRTEDGGYLLWSVAMNRKDDGGNAGAPDVRRPEQPDWLWRMPGPVADR